jgi:uncharacterized protein YfiM (DUF2279 family)
LDSLAEAKESYTPSDKGSSWPWNDNTNYSRDMSKSWKK